MGRASREKGKKGEQEVAQMLRPLFPQVRSKRAGGESATVDRGRDLLGTPGMCVQVKKEHNPRPLVALQEAIGVTAANEFPIAFVKRSRAGGDQRKPGIAGHWVVVLLASDFVDLMKLARCQMERLAMDQRHLAEYLESESSRYRAADEPPPERR